MLRNSINGLRSTRVCANLGCDENAGLERLCKVKTDAIHLAPAEEGIERIEARFSGNGFDLHRHDTYAIGLTLSGVQSFRYRGETRASLPGQIIVIHPDELHDGGAGTETGLRYRMIYLQPDFLAEALHHAGVQGLPFVKDPVLSDPELQLSIVEALEDIDCEMGELKRSNLVSELSSCFTRLAASRPLKQRCLDWRALWQCTDFLKECHQQPVAVKDLENLCGLDRFTLSRQFRQAFGTSPHRYLIMRRLESVKGLLAKGTSLVDAAMESGFADQSHMTRQFKRAFGMTPGTWRNLNAART
ncbi:AraC family transcriptional regulator [uncultured Roseibium sp.]|uniref:AraC family transcriptional regulator n=1 Tax=uncultured Roseibium sp. TaxID=1936171 RepID=UPI002626998D|nr:AraC family transcriptional regulator [uncultured Roseibium sp.]